MKYIKKCLISFKKRNNGFPAAGNVFLIKRTSFLFVSFLVVYLLFYIPSEASNNYAPINAKIPFTCEKDNQGRELRYRIEITPVSENAPTPQSAESVLSGGNDGFFVISITEPGNYVYRMSQIKGTSNDIIYDEKEYDVYVCVIDSGNKELTYSISAVDAKEDEKPEKILFQNRYKSVPVPIPTPVPEPPDISKIGDRTSSKTGEVNSDYVILYALGLLSLFAGAMVYVAVKKRSEKEQK